jgi:mRNA interferase RelE/StbE
MPETGYHKKAIEKRLAEHPEVFESLCENSEGYWKFRVGDYRVVFKISRDEIFIFGIAHRKSIYRDIVKRT